MVFRIQRYHVGLRNVLMEVYADSGVASSVVGDHFECCYAVAIEGFDSHSVRSLIWDLIFMSILRIVCYTHSTNAAHPSARCLPSNLPGGSSFQLCNPLAGDVGIASKVGVESPFQIHSLIRY
jgi:hypothetical protein